MKPSHRDRNQRLFLLMRVYSDRIKVGDRLADPILGPPVVIEEIRVERSRDGKEYRCAYYTKNGKRYSLLLTSYLPRRQTGCERLFGARS